jgi:hypothetical protein
VVTMHIQDESVLHRYLNSRKGAAIESTKRVHCACPCVDNEPGGTYILSVSGKGPSQADGAQRMDDFEDDEINDVVWHPPLLDPDIVLHRKRPAPYRSLLLRLFRDTQDF